MTTLSLKQRTALVTLSSFTLILGYYLVNLLPHVLMGTLEEASLKALWITVIVGTIAITVLGLIVTQIIATSITAVKEGPEVAEAEADFVDERDKLIDLKGSATAYGFASTGTTLAMVLYLFDQPAEVMFSLLIFAGLLAQIAGDIRRLWEYRKGF